MKKLTPKQISRKNTWSNEDEVEFFDAMKRTRSDQARINMLFGRAKSIAPDHPDAATSLLERILNDYPDREDYHEREAVHRLADLSVQIGEPAAGADRLRAFAEDRLEKDANHRYALLEYSRFVVDQACAEHYRGVLDLVPSATHNRPTSPPDHLAGVGESWLAFCDAAHCAHLLGETDLCADYLAKAQEWYANRHTPAPDAYRLWLFRRTRMGSRRIAFVVVRPDFSLAEMRGWVEKTWTKFRPEISFSETGTGERLILAWPEYEVDLILEENPKRAGNVLSYFRKKNLGKFDAEGARELKWHDAGDYDDVDAINIGIQLLDYFQIDPRVAVDIG